MTELVTRSDLDTAVTLLLQEIGMQTLRLTVCVGIMLAAGLSILAAILRLQ